MTSNMPCLKRALSRYTYKTIKQIEETLRGDTFLTLLALKLYVYP